MLKFVRLKKTTLGTCPRRQTRKKSFTLLTHRSTATTVLHLFYLQRDGRVIQTFNS